MIYSLENERDKHMEIVISIIIPVYNVEKYIEKCLKSIINQIYEPKEIILIDDGSIDRSGKICDEYARKYPYIKVIHKINEGSYKARQAGLDIAKGKYIHFIDADDWIENDLYTCLMKEINNDYDMIVFPYSMNYESLKEIVCMNKFEGFYNEDEILKKIMPCMIYDKSFFKFGIEPSLWNKIIKKNLLEYKDIQEKISIGEDALIFYPTLLNVRSLFFYKEKSLYHYRQNEESITNTYREKYFEQNIVLFKKLKKNISDNIVDNIDEQLNYYILFLTQIAIENEMLNPKGNIIVSTQKLARYCQNNYVKNAIKNVKCNDIDTVFKRTLFFLKHRLYLGIFLIKKFRRWVT